MLHCPKNNLNLVHIKNMPVTTGAVATVYVWLLCALCIYLTQKPKHAQTVTGWVFMRRLRLFVELRTCI